MSLPIFRQPTRLSSGFIVSYRHTPLVQNIRANIILWQMWSCTNFEEVPWEIIDMYVEHRPESHLARLLKWSKCQTTRNDDPSDLSPWSTWPTFHKGLSSAEHNSHQLGRDPDTFKVPNL